MQFSWNDPTAIMFAIYLLAMLAIGRGGKKPRKDLTVWLADGRDATPFQGMVSDRLNRAGWYLIVAPIVGLVNFIVCFLAGTGGNWGLWMSGMMVMIGIILLLIARIFDYGMGLQREVDGLL